MHGTYSADTLLLCGNASDPSNQCNDISRSTDESSCPDGTKLWSPQNPSDWTTVIGAFGSDAPDFKWAHLQAPNFIVDITRPQNGCILCGGDGSTNEMNSIARDEKGLARVERWTTSDGSPWWLRSE